MIKEKVNYPCPKEFPLGMDESETEGGEEEGRGGGD